MVNKLKSQKLLIEIVHQLKGKRKKIVTFNGSFDILHLGHIRSLREAKKQGDVLVVLINSDSSIRKYKGSNRPIMSEKQRAEILAAISYVDYVTLFDELNPKKILAKIKPNIHCNGEDWGKYCIERGVVEKNGGKLHLLSWQKGQSSSKLIKKMVDAYQNPSPGAVFLDRDETINFNKQGYIYRKEDFIFIPKAIDALRKLTKSNYKVIIVSNQSGVRRGYFDREKLEKLHILLRNILAKEEVRIDKIYYCPHHPKDKCDCRKPEIGMFLAAVKDFDISLSRSWFIGYKIEDVIAGREANIKTIKLGDRIARDSLIQPHYYAKDLFEAVEMILRKENLAL